MLEKLPDLVPGRVRVGVALAVAERVLDALRPSAQSHAIALAALPVAWAWVEGNDDIDLKGLYDRIFEMDSQSEVDTDPAALAALRTVANALFYLLWLGYSDACEHGRVAEQDVPGEIYDVSEDALEMIERDAAATGRIDEGMAGARL